MKKTKKTVPTRTLVQSLSLLALHSNIWQFPTLLGFCHPALSCHSCALSWFACPVGVFIHYSGYAAFPFIALGTTLLLGVLIGRIFCGWVCPFGFLQDLLHKIPSPKFKAPAWSNYGKYAFLLGGVIALPLLLGDKSPYNFCSICPSAALQVKLPEIILGEKSIFETAILIKMCFTALILATAVMCSRFFCKAVCPIGAMLAPLNYLSFWAIKSPTNNCVSCKKCSRECPTDANPHERIEKSLPANRTAECIVCHDCQPSCPIGIKNKPK